MKLLEDILTEEVLEENRRMVKSVGAIRAAEREYESDVRESFKSYLKYLEGLLPKVGLGKEKPRELGVDMMLSTSARMQFSVGKRKFSITISQGYYGEVSDGRQFVRLNGIYDPYEAAEETIEGLFP